MIKQFLLIVLGCLSLAGCGEAKVTDPNDPRFDPDKFKFSDYRSQDELIDAFRALFPPGTPKSFVDKVFIEAGKAQIGIVKEALEEEPKYIFIPYVEPTNFLRTIKKPFSHRVIYSEDLKIINIRPFGGNKVFINQPDNSELNKMKASDQESANTKV